MIQTAQPPAQPRTVTPVAWLEVPEFLTPAEAPASAGHPLEGFDAMNDDAVELVERSNGYL